MYTTSQQTGKPSQSKKSTPNRAKQSGYAQLLRSLDLLELIGQLFGRLKQAFILQLEEGKTR